jgi:uncharacterized protein YigA (DUF484 family)
LNAHDALPPITEDDIAQFLVNTPDFFERHAELLASVQLTSPHGQRAVSLQERQAEMLREKIRHLELKAAEMIRHGQENVVIAQRLQQWTRRLLAVVEPADVPAAIAQGIEAEFQVPQAALKVWGVDAAWADQPFAQGASDDARAFATSLAQPYCGANPGLEASHWLQAPDQAASLALLPLRAGPAEPAFGLLVLGSSDPRRFTAHMGTDFLQDIAALASAAMSRLMPLR